MAGNDPRALARTLFTELAREIAVPFLPAVLVIALLERMPFGEALKNTLVAGVPALLAVLGILALRAQSITEHALARLPTDAPGQRLQRILELPRKLEARAFGGFLTGLFASSVWLVHAADKPLWHVLPALLCGYGFAAMLNVRIALTLTRRLEPVLAEEFALYPLVRPAYTAWVQPKMGFLLVHAFLAAIVTVTVGFIVAGLRMESYVSDDARTALAKAGQEALWPAIEASLGGIRMETHGLVIAVLVFSAGGAIHTAMQLGRRYAQGAKDLGDAIESLSSGSPRLPTFLGTDELGDLAFGVAAVHERLKQMALLLRQGALQLASSAEQLSGSTARQNETLSRQAAALQETEVTAQEIKQTSLLASQKTEGVLQMAERAEEISKSGESAVEQSLQGLADIRDSVGDMAARIRALGERARQIATITTAVKDLADQSNMLALNAAIEAVRSGEHGKGFSVVAREIRTLADQSIQATNRVREILQDVSDAIRDTVSITEKGSEKVQVSLVQVQSSGESLKALGAIVRDNAAAVRQIAAAVGQQNAGIGEIFEAVKDLSRMMDESLQRVQSSEEAANLVRGVAGEVSTVVRQYGADSTEPTAPAPKAA